MIKPFKIAITNQELEKIYDKVKKYPWHEMPEDGGWEYGTNLDYMKEISKYWVKNFDWHKHEDQINKFKSNISIVELGIDHKEYSHSTKLTDDNIKSLSEDFI